ncbi:hypothetical protein EV401DRAFT_2016591 [Pisolithus croceorrhizus]|nr:hypothetical protein EV401DRAFT_2016591 [Pisolithus croceorrhizus]
MAMEALTEVVTTPSLLPSQSRVYWHMVIVCSACGIAGMLVWSIPGKHLPSAAKPKVSCRTTRPEYCFHTSISYNIYRPNVKWLLRHPDLRHFYRQPFVLQVDELLKYSIFLTVLGFPRMICFAFQRGLRGEAVPLQQWRGHWTQITTLQPSSFKNRIDPDLATFCCLPIYSPERTLLTSHLI